VRLARDNRVDANQGEIIKALEQAMCSVEILDNGDGVPDLLVGRQTPDGRRCYLLEVKSEKGKLTDDQEEWHLAWRGHKSVVRSVDEALAAVGISVAIRTQT
jgi:hypothetical protein